MLNEKTRLKAIVPLLCRWYAKNRKPMPWRDDPSPYHVWLSEIMLQQTRIETVIPYYRRFLEELPTVADLAAVSEEKLMKLWQGLGYYSRAKNLKKAAAIIAERWNGVVPPDTETLLSLPGIGEYTAGAISSIAYHRPEPAVDGNVLRVIARLTGCRDDVMLPATKKAVTVALREIYPAGSGAALFTEGLMELGELICIPNGSPRCRYCPIREKCLAFQEGSQNEIPLRTVKKERKKEEIAVLILSHGLYYAIRRRPGKGLLADMWELPNLSGRYTVPELEEVLRCENLAPANITPCGNYKHIFTHVEWNMTGYLVKCLNITDRYLWKTAPEIEADYAVPTAFRHFIRYMKV